MKVILSPSKEQNFKAQPVDDMKTLPHFRKSKAIVERIQGFSKDELSQRMDIKGQILDSVYETYRHFGHNGILPAIQGYSGLAFRQIPVESYSDDELYYLEDHVRILSALYGMITPLTGISAYRLDMKMKVLDESLYSYWKPAYENCFDCEETVVNLASKEFSKLVKHDMVTVEFKEYKSGRLRVVGTNAKKARGLMVDFMVRHRVEMPEALKTFNCEGWSFKASLSDASTYVFVRGEENGGA